MPAGWPGDNQDYRDGSTCCAVVCENLRSKSPYKPINQTNHRVNESDTTLLLYMNGWSRIIGHFPGKNLAEKLIIMRTVDVLLIVRLENILSLA